MYPGWGKGLKLSERKGRKWGIEATVNEAMVQDAGRGQ
jgi:hypothetical protein